MTRSPSAGPSLAAFLAGAGALHFVVPGFYDAMIPEPLPGRARAWTYASGVAEIAVAAAVAHPRTRPAGARAASLLFAAVFPANVWMARQAQHSPSRVWRVGNVARLPLQAPLFVWAHRAGRDIPG